MVRAVLLWLLVLTGSSLASAQTRPAAGAAEAPSRVVGVTVYQGNALVTREVQVPAGRGHMELVVGKLPAQTIDSSLYTESAEGLRVLSTRYRTRAVRDDARADVRAKESEIRQLQAEAESLRRQSEVLDQNLALLGKLESFTAATLQELSEKGLLSAEATMGLAKFVMEDRSAKAQQQVDVQQRIRANAEAIGYAQRELAELTAGANRTERDAVIVIDKADGAAGVVRLNYLVSAATWQAQYRFRGSGDGGKQPVQVEYLAGVEQQSGEDWPDVNVVLSNAQPMLNADPPELLALDLTTVAIDRSAPNQPIGESKFYELGNRSVALRKQARDESVRQNTYAAGQLMNQAAAAEQTRELLAGKDEFARFDGSGAAPTTMPFGMARATADAARRLEGPSVTYRLASRHTVPSRNDPQLIEVARLELSAEFSYKAVPVLTPHVYRLATLTNTSDRVLLAGEATMYLGSDFVGRMQLPLVATGEPFTVGFGVDPQLQVERELIDKRQAVQGGNQVHTFDYRIRVSSLKAEPAAVQVWDRLPKGDTQAVAVTIASAKPELSVDAAYRRLDHPKNLLRWDLTVPSNARGEAAVTVDYQFKMEYDRGVRVSGFEAQR